MTIATPTSLEGVYDALDDTPEAHLLAGGTDFMVEVNFSARQPDAVIALGGVAELREWDRDGDVITLGAGITYTELMAEPLAALFPGLAAAARTVGSPQIRNAGTVGGNVATASPAGDALPILYALDAAVVIASRHDRRTVPIRELISGVKQTTLRPGEVVLAVQLPVLRGGQEFLKVGTRNAMVIAAANLALVVDRDGRTVRCAIGAVAPTVRRATEAEAWVASRVDWDRPAIDDPRTYEAFGDLVAGSADPIDDHRSTAAYRRHAVAVMARRALLRVL